MEEENSQSLLKILIKIKIYKKIIFFPSEELFGVKIQMDIFI